MEGAVTICMVLGQRKGQRRKKRLPAKFWPVRVLAETVVLLMLIENSIEVNI